MGKKAFKGKRDQVPAKGNAKSKATAQDYEDEIDAFVNKRSKVSLENNSEESEDEIEPVYDLEQFQDKDENEDEDDLSEDEDLMMPGVNDDDDVDADDSNEVDEDEMLSKWGKSKGAFYNNEYEKNKDVEAEEFEENEVKRVRSKKLAQLDEEDLEDEFLAAKQTAKTKDQAISSDDKLLKAMNQELGNINLLEGADMSVEQITRDSSGLSTTQKLEILISESPVLLQLLQEFKQRMTEINNNIKPILQKVQIGQVATTKGVSFLEAKFHLLLSYCINISFYLLLKASGKAVKDHPVIDQLVKIRTILEKLKPLDQKLKTQIDKLVKMAITGTISQDDPKSHRPNPATMMKPSENEVEEGEPVNDEDNIARSVDAEYDAQGVYKIPKLAEMYFEDKSLAAQQKRRERLLQKAQRSQLMKEIVNELGEHPEEAAVIGAETEDMDDEERERQQYEEDNYIRFNLSKKDKNKMLQKQRKKQSIDNLEDFDDIAVLDDGNQSGPALSSILKKKNMREVIDDIVKEKKTKSNAFAGDLDLPYRDPEQAASLSKKRKEYRKQLTNQDDDFNNDFDDFYESKHKKQRQLQDYSSEDEARLNNFDFDGKRAIGKNIESNRGLTKNRNKKTKNPRTKFRNKFEKAQQKRKSQVREFKRPQGGYGGENTGIKSHVVRSRKL